MPQASRPESPPHANVPGMKVTRTGGPTSVGGPGGARAAPAAPGFAPISTPSGPAGPATASGVAQLSSLDVLIALQDVGGPLERRKRAVNRGGSILAALEGLKLDLLEGRLTPGAMEALARAVREQRASTDDPRLEELLDEIETRAAVEMAKLESVRVAA
jgi:hypothetical protein